MSMLKFTICLVSCFFFTLTLFAQTPNRPVPYGVFPYEFVQNDTSLQFYLGINTSSLGGAVTDPDYKYKRGVILDPDGFIAWYQNRDPLNANAISGFHYNEANGVFQEVVSFSSVNKEFRTLDTNLEFLGTTVTVVVDPDSHEFLIDEDGSKYISTRHDETYDLSAYLFDGSPMSATTNVQCGGVQEFDAGGSLVFEWNSCDEIHPSEAYGFGYNQNGFDYFHINAIDVDTDDNLLVSARHTNSIIKINHVTGAVMWRLGGLLSDFTFVGDTGFSGQHDVRAISPDVVSIFSNGNLDVPQQSRGVMYQLDTVNWTATLIDEIDPVVPIYGGAMGNYSKIDGYDVINYGAVFRPSPNIVIYDNLKNVAAAYYFKDSSITYRATPFHLDFTLPRPVISCVDSSGTLYLKAPAGYPTYEWSNGETTQIILPVLGETYQVYVPYGVGNLGSIPHGYDGTCFSNVEIDELSSTAQEVKLLRTVDMLGRTVSERRSGVVYIEIYSNGTTKRVFTIE